MQLKTMMLCAAALLLMACNGGDDGTVGTGSGGDPPPTGTALTIFGAAQKGPFVIGSEVLLSQLQPNGMPSANTVLTEISDNLGNFKSYVTKSGPVLITADGYHFNEITGALSEGRLLLKAIYNATSAPDQHAFINILTHLAYKRTLKLLGQGIAIADAIKQAESEIVNAFKPVLPVSGITDFTALNIYNVDARLSNGNAYALALSSTIYQYAMLKQKQSIGTSVDAQLTDILNNLADDLANNGKITSPAVITALVQATRLLRPDKIRKNLEDRSFDVSGTKLPVANIDLFIDTDGDGIVNAEDPDDDNDGIPDEIDPSPYVYSEAPVLIKPDVTNALPSKQEILFEWTSSDYAKNFEIQISKSADFAATVVSKNTPGKTFSITLDVGVYYVRARSQNVYNYWSVWNAPMQFQVGVYTKSYRTSGTDTAERIIQTSDGGFAILGTTASGQVHNTAVLLLRLDIMGNVLRKNIYDTIEDDSVSNLTQTSDGGFLLITTTILDGLQVFRLIKTDSVGIQEWSKTMDGLTYYGSHVLSESDGVVFGYTAWQLNPDGSNSFFQTTPNLVKIDSQGNVLWRYRFDETVVDFESLRHLSRGSLGSYLLIGSYIQRDYIYLYQEQMFLAQLSADHASFSYSALTNNMPMSIYGGVFTSDQNVLLKTNSMTLVKSDLSGVKLWSYTANNSFDTSYQHAPLVERSGVITYSGQNNTGGIRMIMLNQEGYEVRTHDYSASFDFLYSHADMIATADGGFAILGTIRNNNWPILDNNILLIKTDAEGNAFDVSSPRHYPLE